MLLNTYHKALTVLLHTSSINTQEQLITTNNELWTIHVSTKICPILKNNNVFKKLLKNLNKIINDFSLRKLNSHDEILTTKVLLMCIMNN